MAVDAHKNFAYSTLTNSPGTAGTSFIVQAGNGALFPAVPFNATVWPAGVFAINTNAEVVRVTAISTDTLTVTRNTTTEPNSGANVNAVAGYQIAATLTSKTLTDAEASFGVSTGGNTSGSTGVLFGPQVVLVGGNNITLSQSTDATSRITVTISGVSFSNSNGVSFGLNAGTLTASVADPILSTYAPYQAVGLSTVLVGVPTATSAGISVYPFYVDQYVSAGILNLAYSMSFVTVGTSSGRQTMGLALGIYTRNVSTLSSFRSTSFSIGVTGQNSSYTINQPTSTAYSAYGATGATNSAGSNISSGYTGVKLVGFPINTLMTPGNYWLAMIGTNSTSSVNVGISMSHFGAAMATFGSAMGPIGSFSSAFTAGQDPRAGRWNVGQGSWTSAGSVTMIPASMNMTSISAIGLTYPLINFWST